MPVYTLTTQADTYKIATIKNHAWVFGGKMSFISNRPAHQCNEILSDSIAVIIYNSSFKQAVHEIVNELFTQFGPVYYGMVPDTSEEEFTQLKIHSCCCGFSTMG